jgi:hypothetical protein
MDNCVGANWGVSQDWFMHGWLLRVKSATQTAVSHV